MSDQDVIQKAYEADLTQIYVAFATAFTHAMGDKRTEADLDAHFKASVAHASHIRDRAIALLGGRPASTQRTAPRNSGYR